MNYNYPQPQFQNQQVGYSYRPVAQYPQWTPPQQPQQIRPVSSVEEVRACPIDFDGSIFYFTDVANKKIYTKQINLDGTVSINIYELKADQAVDSTVQYVTKSEFENVINQLYTKFSPLLNPVEPEVKSTPAAQQPITQPKKPLFEI